jgi:DNA polymerase III epsilon subunit-like protein
MARPIIWLDTETTGLSAKKHEIIEFAAAREDGAVLEMKIQPQRIENAHPKALEVNGYSEEAWAEAVTPAEAVESIIEFARGCEMAPMYAGHNVNFDWCFLQALFEQEGRIDDWPFHYHNLDTMVLAQEHLKPLGQRSVSLHYVCKTLRVSNKSEHTALADVRRTMAVWNKLCRANVLQRLVWRHRIAKLNKAADAKKAAREAAKAAEEKADA